MIVELHGGDFANRGSELMIRSTIDALDRRLAGVRFALDPSRGPYEKRAELGLRQLFPPRRHAGGRWYRWGLRGQRLGAWLPEPLERVAGWYGCVPADRVDAVLDLAGFAYSDQWGPGPVRDLEAFTRIIKRRRERPFVLLPQAFGPFEDRRSRRAMASVLGRVDLAWARDPTSRSHLRELAPRPGTIGLSPDITLSYPPPAGPDGQGPESRPGGGKEEAGVVSVVPNYRMLDRGDERWAETYVDALTEAVRHCSSLGFEVDLVEHDASGQDRGIVEAIGRRAPGAVRELVLGEEALALKRRLGESRFVIASRYHALVGALTSGVPVVCIGWSHKYDELLESFGCPELAVGPDDGVDALRERIDELADTETNVAWRRKIGEALESARRAHASMWDRVAEVLLRASPELAARDRPGERETQTSRSAR